jgi:hypothetical protein
MQYTAKNIENFMQSYEKHVSHYIVAHTHFRPFINPQSKYTGNNKIRIGKMAEQASKDCRYALNCFSKLLYPTASNKPIRFPYVYRPLTFVTIEGANETTDKAQTIHFNIAIGNLPKVLTTDDIKALFSHAWHDKAKLSADIQIYEKRQNVVETWFGYTLKEAQQARYKAWATDGIWDVNNCWIPHAALNAD